MRQRAKTSSSKSNSPSDDTVNKENSGAKVSTSVPKGKNVTLTATRSSYVILALFVLAIYGAWAVYHYQFETLPVPLSSEQVGKRGFSEHEAMKHVRSLARLGPHSVGSDALETALKHPWSDTVRLAIDLEAMGIGGKSGIFQAGPHPWAIENYALVAKYPSAQIVAENDKLALLKPGSLQHLGENMLAFLLHAVFMGGYPAAISLALSFSSIVLMWICSVIFSSAVAFILPFISSSPVPFIASPWLVVGLFGAPALLGAFTGQHMGFLILESYLDHNIGERRRNLPDSLRASVAKLDAERWVYKAGLLQWLVLLMVGNYYRVDGLLEATLSPARLPKPLKTVTLLIGLFVPFLLSSGMVIRLTATAIGSIVRFVRNPGTTPEWMGNVIIAIFIATIVCLMLVYLISYIHISGAKVPIILALAGLFAISLGAVWGGIVPPFTEDIARAVNVVHVVDATGDNLGKPVSYISLFSTTPGNLNKEANHIGEGFVCGRDRHLDFVTFSVDYGCWTDRGAETGWAESDIPTIHHSGREKRRTTCVKTQNGRRQMDTWRDNGS
ncbi:endoplasmic reticulum metallopeptidase 1 [Phtheirospermum japonicum]|uniref:Endoplasmic reticulum metallopeptidase 1 n=1 Tax=Phtheirospermum japonicum TaxID=374723 RepID=A0A830B765_9LAMI|nr:endoplasmic reticulum metallopeptidase 1 [Phtheirospermum japonicum]